MRREKFGGGETISAAGASGCRPLVCRKKVASAGDAHGVAIIKEDGMASTTTGLAAVPARTLRFWNTTNGKKAVMAATGVVLAGFVCGHLIGNLQIFLGPDRFNGYARLLKSLPEL